MSLELTFDKEYSFSSVENRFSDYNGKPVIKIGVNIKDASGQLKDMDSILSETAARWDNLDKAQ